MSYPNYTRAERIADGIVHVLGVTGALIGVAILLAFGTSQMGLGTYTATLVYATAMVLMLSASAAYHMGAHTPARPLLRRIDHAAIWQRRQPLPTLGPNVYQLSPEDAVLQHIIHFAIGSQ